jgi:CRISPR-associated endonuclease/helicase Cas3
MTTLPPAQFSDFFRAVHHHEPFDWQKRLAREVLEGVGWQDIRVPTGCGKTSVLDIALFELAVQADLAPNQRTAARRICFVIDRRLVVDEVTEHAIEIARAIRAAMAGKRQEPVLSAVAERLARLAADQGRALRVVRLRGGAYRDDGWVADPLTPTILISTVDQIGSRLLFRGYGVSPRSRPVHAGLLAFDTRIILDEAHLSSVFATTVERIRKYQRDAQCAPVSDQRRIAIIRMSATAREAECFELAKEERKDIRLAPRLEAHKYTELVSVPVESITKDLRTKQPRKAKEQERKNRQQLLARLAAVAEQFAFQDRPVEGDSRIVGVVANRVSTARDVFDRLRGANNGQPERDAILLTGRIRPFDRDQLLQRWLPRIRAGRDTKLDKPLFVVATQTVEVGANLDFDALVTEAAPLDALRQRFGRLDRLGRRHERNMPSPAAIVIRTDQKSSAHRDPIYGSAIAETWKWLSDKRVTGKSKRVDFGANHLDPKLGKDLAPMLAPTPVDPLLFPAHLDAWVQTNPEPEPDPDVEPFLHGKARSAADVQVVWRADLNDDNQEYWSEIVALMPPRTREALPVPVYEVQRWLRNEATGDIADVEGAASDGQDHWQARARRALRWFGPADGRTRPADPDKVRPGDTIVVPANYGGADAFGWNPTSGAPVTDVAEACLVQLVASYPQNAFRRPRLRFRLRRQLLPSVGEEAADRLRMLLKAAVAVALTDDQGPWPAVQQLLRAIRLRLPDPARIAAVDAVLQATSPPQIRLYPQRDGLVLIADARVSLPEQEAVPVEEAEGDEQADDEVLLTAGGCPVTLSDHTLAVRDRCIEFARRSGLEDDLCCALSLAASWHDAGKRDTRFQAWLHGSELKALAALAADQPLAKSGRDPKHWRSSDVFGYGKGLRHEFVSVRLFEQSVHGGPVDSELVKLLIGTHHGYGCAFAPAAEDPRPVDVMLTDNGRQINVSSDHGFCRLDSGWTDLFWKMVRQYGWWGLALLEAFLITADRFVSAREQRTANSGGTAA